MLQEIFRIPLGDNRIPIYGYGLMMVLGFLAAAQLAKYLARRSGLDGEFFVNLALLGLFAGIVGARVSHILENLPEFTRSDRSAWDNFLNMINLRSGGLTYYGGFLLAFPTLVLYGWYKKVPVRLGMDIIAPCLMIGLAFGRIGCFLNGCCYGQQCDLPWAVQFPYYSSAYVDQYHAGALAPADPRLVRDPQRKILLTPAELASQPELLKASHREHALPLHPAQIYSAVTAFLLAFLLLAYFTVPHAPGRAFALLLVLEGATRFLLELLRAEPPVLGPFSLSMLISFGLVILGILLWILFGRIAPRPAAA